MTPHDLVGKRVRILTWDDLRDVLRTDPRGTIAHVTDFGLSGLELTVCVEGLGKNYVFGMDEVGILPEQSGGRSTGEPV